MYSKLTNFDVMKNLLILIGFVILNVATLNSCKPDIEGCTDPKADNYDAFATIDGENCVYDGVLGGTGGTDSTDAPISGCMDSTASNYNPLATIDDGSCEILGCTDPEAENYNPLANVDDGSCIDTREKFVGDWTVVSDCPAIIQISDPQTISFDTTIADSIFFKPFTVFGDASGSINGFDVTIPQKNYSIGGFLNITFDGSGTMNSNKDQIIITLNYDAGFAGSGTCTLTYDKL